MAETRSENDGADELCSSLKISETILKTGRLDEMKAWYTTVLGVRPFFEHAPKGSAKPDDFGGQTRASDLRMCFFRLSLDYPHVQSIGIFEEPGVEASAPKTMPGLHHMQLMTNDFAELAAKFDDLARAGLEPHRSANHGVMTSFYYRDPDGNNVELTAQNFDSLAEMAAFMRSAEFKANPSGVELEPDDFIGRYRAGVPVGELTKLPA